MVLMNNHFQDLTAIDSQRTIINRFQYLSWVEFSGSLEISLASGAEWEILFYQGKVVWSFDRQQPNRFWQRQLRTHFKGREMGLDVLFQAAEHVQPKAFALSSEASWQYKGLTSLILLREVKSSDLVAIISTGTQELIFDLLQASQTEKLIFRSQPEVFIDRPQIVVSTGEIITKAEKMWQEWYAQRLGYISPNKTPTIAHPVQLYRQTTPIVYQNLVQIITGKRTLREIATEINEDLLLLTRSLTRYIQTGIIELRDLPDLQTPELDHQSLPDVPIISTSSFSTFVPSKLIVCIDDNPHICETMKAIVTESGYRFVSIQDATQALPRLLEHKPDLIFLDLVMPKINGYEICSQIKRISTFANTPIIILTGKDGLFDKVRAKVVGSSEFVTKPISKPKIDTILEKWLLSYEL